MPRTEYEVFEFGGKENLEDMIIEPLIEFINKQIGRNVVKKFEKGDIPLID